MSPTTPPAAPRTFAPPTVHLGYRPQQPVVSQMPAAGRAIYLVLGGFFLAAFPFALVNPDAMQWADGIDLPQWTTWFGPVISTALGLFIVSFVRSKTVVDGDTVTFRSGVLGTRSVDLATVSGIRAFKKVVETAGVFHRSTQIILERDGRPCVLSRSDMSEIDAVAEIAVRWWVARPELVTDEGTAAVLTEFAHELASRNTY